MWRKNKAKETCRRQIAQLIRVELAEGVGSGRMLVMKNYVKDIGVGGDGPAKQGEREGERERGREKYNHWQQLNYTQH